MTLPAPEKSTSHPSSSLPDHSAENSPGEPGEELVPDEVIPHQTLPPLRYRDLPEPPVWWKLIGPSILLAGLGLGSGELVLWPQITYQAGFLFFWACILGVTTQFFLNMEIARWTLVTGESAIVGFCRLTRFWAPVFFLANLLAWVWPAWATGAGTLLAWIFVASPGAAAAEVTVPQAPDLGILPNLLGIGGLVAVGIVLTAGPVVYNTVERIQTFLVAVIFVLLVILAAMVVHPYAVWAMCQGAISIGQMPPPEAGLGFMALLGALAFAGAGGTLNLGQSNFLKDKGYGMGTYIGRLTSPVTGKEEASSEIGYHFRHTPTNVARWRRWWRAANIEHFFSFFATCLICLILLQLVAYSLFYDESGQLKPGTEGLGQNLDFLWAEGVLIGRLLSDPARIAFLVMGAAMLLSTELGILDVTSRVASDLIKVNFLRESETWSESRLYFVFLWGQILLGSGILLALAIDNTFGQTMLLFRISSTINGAVMLIYSVLLLYMNMKILSRSLAPSPLRFTMLIWSCAFFGYFTWQALQLDLWPKLMGNS